MATESDGVQWGKDEGEFTAVAGCSTTIGVQYQAAFSDAAHGAAARWNYWLTGGLPTFVVGSNGSSGKTVTINWGDSTSQPNDYQNRYYCVLDALQAGVIKVYLWPRCPSMQLPPASYWDSSSYGKASYAQLGDAISHELGHALGYTKHIASGLPSDVAGQSGKCAMWIPGPPLTGWQFAQSLCEHEIAAVLWAYEMRGAYPYFERFLLQNSEPTVTFSGGPNSQVIPGDTVTVSIVNLNGFDDGITDVGSVALASTDSFAWTTTGPTANSTGRSSLRMIANGLGSVTYHARLAASAAWSIQSISEASTGVFSVAIPNPPTALSAPTVGTTSATVQWTNGFVRAGTTTHFQYRVHTGSWGTADTVATHATSRSLTGLTVATLYDFRIWYTYRTFTSDSASGQFTTLGPLTVNPFSFSNCSPGPGSYNTFTFNTTTTGPSTGTTWEIRETSTANGNPATGVLIGSGSGSGTNYHFMYPVQFLGSTKSNIVYFWVRFSGNGQDTGWVANNENPLDISFCDL
jgi:hypothetical protein